MKSIYHFINDPGHAWLEVPLAELVSLGITAKISPYSYVRGDMAYLEEDCDAMVFLTARTVAGNNAPTLIDVHEDPCEIRNYKSFDPRADYRSGSTIT